MGAGHGEGRGEGTLPTFPPPREKEPPDVGCAPVAPATATTATFLAVSF